MTILQSISEAAWLLLVVSLPTSAATPRMRLWRGVKALGGAALRDGAYLLPNVAGLRAQLQTLTKDAASEHGKVWILSVQAADAQEDTEYRALFDRSAEYASWMTELSGARAMLGTAGEAELLRIARRQGRGFDAIRKIDFFPNEASARADAQWRDFNAAIDIMLSPGEPHGVAGSIPRRTLPSIRDDAGPLGGTSGSTASPVPG